MLDYSKKLNHPKWQQKRLKIYERDGWTCCLCDDTETSLHVHHKYYSQNSEPWQYHDNCFITYCEHCHKLIEHIKGSCFIPTKIYKIIKEFYIRYICLIDGKILIIDYSIEQDKFHSAFIMTHSNLEKIIDFIN